MRTRLAAVLAVLAVWFLGVSRVAAQDIPVTATLTVDNRYELYVGNAEGTEFRLVGRTNTPPPGDWEYAETWTFTIRPEEFLYVVGWDLGSPAMFIGNFSSPAFPEALLLTTKTPGVWQSLVIPTGYPGFTGDVNLADVRAAIASGSWQTPAAEAVQGCRECPWNVPGLHPDARHIWHDTIRFGAPYVVFRASAIYLTLPVPPPCEEQLAEALAEIERLNAALGQSEQQLNEARAEIARLNVALAQSQAELTAALAEVERLNAALDQCQQNLGALEARLAALMTQLEGDFRTVFKHPTFTIPGATPLLQLEALVGALKGLERGPKLQVFKKLGGKPGR